jgi:hypothetical protein
MDADCLAVSSPPQSPFVIVVIVVVVVCRIRLLSLSLFVEVTLHRHCCPL